MDLVVALDIHRDFSRALAINKELGVMSNDRISHDGPNISTSIFFVFPSASMW